MFTKSLVQQPVKVSDSFDDVSSINRLLAAAAINPHFKNRLLENPKQALNGGFGGEQFHLSQPTLELLVSVQASTLSEFVCKLNEKLSNRLHIF